MDKKLNIEIKRKNITSSQSAKDILTKKVDKENIVLENRSMEEQQEVNNKLEEKYGNLLKRLADS